MFITWDSQRAECISNYFPAYKKLLAAQPDWGLLCFLFSFIFLWLNYCGQAALSISLFSTLCGCIIPKQNWHAGDYVMLYWFHSWHHSEQVWVSLFCHKRETPPIELHSHVGIFWIDDYHRTQELRSHYDCFMLTNAQIATAVCIELEVFLMIIDRCECLILLGFS